MRILQVVVVCAALMAARGPALAQESKEAAAPEPSSWEQVVQLYEKAKAAGEQVPQDVYQWVKDDIGSIGGFEYRVREISMSKPESLEEQLNELGAERWECIWIRESAGKSLFVFKRPKKSYLKNVPLSQLMKLVPAGDTAGE